MKTYRELEVGDTIYVLTGDMEIEETVILAIRQELDYMRLDLRGKITDTTYIKYVERKLFNNNTRSWSTATNLKDIKKLRAERIADKNKCHRNAKIQRTWNWRSFVLNSAGL